MYGQCAGLTKSFSTLVTLEGLFFGMNVAMVSQVVLSAKALATLSARERSLVCVSPFVDHHVVTFGELSMAELADEPLLGSGASMLVAEVKSGVIRGWRC